MPSSGQERQRQHPKQRQQQNQQVQQQPIHSPPEPGCCGHIADAYGNFAVPRDCENEHCSMRQIHTINGFFCPDCENTRIVWQVCGCPPELADDDYNYGLANDEDTPATANNVGRSGEGSGKRRRAARRGGERRSVDRQ